MYLISLKKYSTIRIRPNILTRKFSVDSVVLNAIPVSSFLFVTLKSGLSFEYSILPTLIIFASLLYLVKDSIKFSIVEWVVIALSLLAFLSIIFFQNISNFKELIFYLTFLAGLFLARKCPAEKVEKLAFNFLKIYAVVGVLDTLFPAFARFKLTFLTRSYFSIGESVRGVSSLATEPSYFVLVVFACWVIYFSARKFRDIDRKFFVVALLCLVLSKSTMSIFVLPLLLISLDKKYRKYIVGFTATFFLLFFPLIVKSSRFGQIVNILIKLDFERILLDSSAGGRYYYLMKDLYISVNGYFVPFGTGSYYMVASWYNLSEIIPAKLLNIYNYNISGSLLGRYLVEYGVLLILLLFFLLFRLIKRTGVVKGTFMFFFVVLIYFQMISLVFYPISLSMGILLYYLSTAKTSGFGKSNI